MAYYLGLTQTNCLEKIKNNRKDRETLNSCRRFIIITFDIFFQFLAWSRIPNDINNVALQLLLVTWFTWNAPSSLIKKRLVLYFSSQSNEMFGFRGVHLRLWSVIISRF